MKIIIRKIGWNKKAVAHPLEFIMAFSVLILAFFFVFSSLNSLFIQEERDNFVLKAKAIGISERLIKDFGDDHLWDAYDKDLIGLGLAHEVILDDNWYQSSYIIPDRKTYSSDPSPEAYNQSLAVMKTIHNYPIANYTYKAGQFYPNEIVRNKITVYGRIDYRTLDSERIYALQKINYSNAKAALGLEEYYDFNILIQDIYGREILKYGKPYKLVDAVESYSRTIRVYLHYETRYVGAELTVYVF